MLFYVSSFRLCKAFECLENILMIKGKRGPPLIHAFWPLVVRPETHSFFNDGKEMQSSRLNMSPKISPATSSSVTPEQHENEGSVKQTLFPETLNDVSEETASANDYMQIGRVPRVMGVMGV